MSVLTPNHDSIGFQILLKDIEKMSVLTPSKVGLKYLQPLKDTEKMSVLTPQDGEEIALSSLKDTEKMSVLTPMKQFFNFAKNDKKSNFEKYLRIKKLQKIKKT